MGISERRASRLLSIQAMTQTNRAVEMRTRGVMRGVAVANSPDGREMFQFHRHSPLGVSRRSAISQTMPTRHGRAAMPMCLVVAVSIQNQLCMAMVPDSEGEKKRSPVR